MKSFFVYFALMIIFIISSFAQGGGGASTIPFGLVGETTGTLSVSPTGSAVYEIPIGIPQG